MNKLIIISGPTASGKTQTSINLARFIKKELGQNAEVINFDSLLFYKEITIGTAKPTKEEQQDVIHHLIDIETIASPLNAADFIKLAQEKITELHQRNIIPILIGGSAFYLRALLKGMYQSSTPNDELKEELESLFKKEGIAPFVDFLKQNDPEALTYLHVNDHYRIMRAVEHFKMTGEKISDQKKELDSLNPYDFSQMIHPWDAYHIYLDLPKDQHFEIIQKRTKKMFQDGLISEIESLKNLGFNLTEKPLQSIGYKETIEYLNGLFKSEEECIERISISTRQLAKSQRTFFNKIVPKENFNPLNDQIKIQQEIAFFIKGKK